MFKKEGKMAYKKKLMMYLCSPDLPRLETELEIADIHRKEGYEVVLISCMGDFNNCYSTNRHRLRCMSCTSRLKAGHKWIGKDVVLKNLHYVFPEQKRIIDKILSQPLKSWDDLRSIKVEGDDIGDAVFSEIISILRDTNPPFDKQNALWAHNVLEVGLRVHFSILNHLNEEKPDKFILFNGRIASYRPALRTAVSLGIDTKVFEVHFYSYKKYMLTDNTYPHNPHEIARQISIAYETSAKTEKEKEQIASKWYRDREYGSDDQFLFTRRQNETYKSPKLVDESILKVCIFISSEDELFAIPERKSPFYNDQNDGIACIADDLSGEKILFIVRAHPNLMGLRNTQVVNLEEVCSTRSNIEYIPPESKIKTYELIDSCDVVLTFGSTVGIEAVYKNKPSILMGVGTYNGFKGTIEPGSHEELVSILKESARIGHIPDQYMPSVEDMQKAATKYAFGFMEFGIDLQYQNPRNFVEKACIEKNGVKSYIRPHFVFRIMDLMFRIMNIAKKAIFTPVKYFKDEFIYKLE